MNKNKGFTLIELLAVVAILTILSLIITPIIDKNIKKSKNQAYRVQIENIRMAGQTYYSDNSMLRPDVNESVDVSLQTLIDNGYIDKGLKNPKTGSPFSESVFVKLKNDNGTYKYLVCPFEQCS